VKQYIGGKQARPDSGYSFPVYGREGELLGEAPLGNRKDIRNAVEAARNASGWAKNFRAQSRAGLYYLAENMIQRRDEIAHRLSRAVGEIEQAASVEVDLSIQRIFTYAAWADKYDGQVHNPPGRNIAIAMNEAGGAIGILAPSEAPLLSLLSLVLPAIAVGNTVVAMPSEKLSAHHRRPLSAARHERSARRRGESRSGSAGGAGQDARRARRHRGHLVLPQ
jgi:aldehyde dehydrogenase (NAD+)